MSSIEFFRNKGFISLEDNAEFRVMEEAVQCFKRFSIPSQRACFEHPMEDNTSIWFPNIAELKDNWMNIEKNNGNIIYEINIDSLSNKKHIESFTTNPENKDIRPIRVTFTKGKKGGYIFKGVYKVDISKSNTKDGLAWVRFETKAKTY